MFGTGGPFVKLNKPGTERQILYDLWHSEIIDFTKIGNCTLVTRGWGE